jgi:hypothetical protein
MEHFLGEKWYPKVFGHTEERLYKEISDYVTNNPKEEDFKIIELQKGEYTDPVKHPHFPVIHRGAAAHWSCMGKWTFDYFSENYGDVDVTIINNKGGVLDPEEPAMTLKFRDYIANLKKGTKKYLKFSRIVDEEDSLRQDFDYPWLRKFRPKGAKNELNYFFMGGKNTLTPIHNGFAETIFVQIEGVKKWVFYPTHHRLFIGVRPRRYNYFYSEANPYKLNDPKFPLLKLASRYEFLLHPGDVLYFPSLIWHQVENVTDSIGVAYKFATLSAGFTSSKMLFTCFMLATKPWLINTLLPWKGDIYDYKKKQ